MKKIFQFAIVTAFIASSCNSNRQEGAQTSSQENDTAGMVKNANTSTVSDQRSNDSSLLNDDKNKGEIKVLKTKTGKIITVEETHPLGASLSNVRISTKGFKKDTLFKMVEIDPVADIKITDLDKDGFEEIYIFSSSAGSGSSGTANIFASKKDETLIPVSFPQPTEQDFKKGKAFEGYMGHDSYAFSGNYLVQSFPVYGKNDPNSSPSKGRANIYYRLTNNNTLVIEKTKRFSKGEKGGN